MEEYFLIRVLYPVNGTYALDGFYKHVMFNSNVAKGRARLVQDKAGVDAVVQVWRMHPEKPPKQISGKILTNDHDPVYEDL